MSEIVAGTDLAEKRSCTVPETIAIQNRLRTLLELALAIGKREGLIGQQPDHSDR